MASNMRATVAVIHRTGAPEVLELEERDVADPGPGEALVRQTAIGVNFADIYMRKGEPGPHSATHFPAILGAQASGVVEAVGPGVCEVKPGDRVSFVLPESYASLRLAPADRLVVLPDDVSEEVAAATLLRAMTAEYLSHRLFPLKPGHVAVIQAAAGGVGLILTQWAKALGAEVIGLAGGPEKTALAKANGCDHVVDYRAVDFAAAVREITRGEGAHVVYDSVGRDTFMDSLECLRPMGMAINYGTASGPVAPFPLQHLHSRSLIVTRPTLRTYVASRELLDLSAGRVFEAHRQGRIKLEVGPRYPFAEVRRAHADLEGRRTVGAMVLTV